MTILARENDIYPENLFEMAEASPADRQWWALYTRSRREKALMRKLLGLSIPHYGVISPRRFKTPKGRVYTSYEPLFSNYVFLFGDDGERQTALKTNCISRCVPVGNGPELQRDLRQLRELIDMEVPLRPESRLEAGRLVQIRAGKFRGFRGTIIRRENEIRLLVAVKFLQQGASMLLEDFEVDALDEVASEPTHHRRRATPRIDSGECAFFWATSSAVTDHIVTSLANTPAIPAESPALQVAKDSDSGYELILEPGRAERHYWRDLWNYRELFYILAWRDISVRYKQTVIGVAWALLQPLLTMLVMTVVFGLVAKLPSEGKTPYAIMVFVAMLPWQFFAASLSASSQSLVGSANLISKVYFPRMIIPAAAVITSFVDLLIGFLILIGMMAWYQFWPSWRIVTLPFFMGMAFLAAMGPGLLLTALNVKYRDFRYVIPFIVQFGLYISPVGYSSSVIRERLGERAFALYSLNPMVGVIDGFRWAILGEETKLYGTSFLLSGLVIVACLSAGIWYFRATEKTFADVI